MFYKVGHINKRRFSAVVMGIFPFVCHNNLSYMDGHPWPVVISG